MWLISFRGASYGRRPDPGREPDPGLRRAVRITDRAMGLTADATPRTAAGRRPALTGPAAAGNEYENLAH
ncbi:hypothetical protein GCM10010149_01540 [Nonomuraea roseoviolacea subsp. roseoviolacea]